MKEVEKKVPKNLNHKEHLLITRDAFKNERTEEMKRVKYNHPKGTVYRSNLPKDETTEVLDKNYKFGTTTSYTPPTGRNEKKIMFKR